MLTVLLGFHLAAHLLTAQSIKSNLEQMLVPNDLTARVVIVQWTFKSA